MRTAYEIRMSDENAFNGLTDEQLLAEYNQYIDYKYCSKRGYRPGHHFSYRLNCRVAVDSPKIKSVSLFHVNIFQL